MTAPFLPTPSLGNVASDFSTAAVGFVKGLQDEKERRRQQALEEALLHMRAQASTLPGLKFQLEQQQFGEAAQSYIQKYPELSALSGNPEEVINRGRERDTEGLLGVRPRPPVQMSVENEPGKPMTGFAQPPPMAPGQFTPLGPAQTTFAPGQQPAGVPPMVPMAQPGQQPVAPAAPTSQALAPGQFQPVGGARISPSLGYLSTPRPAELDAATWAPGVLQGFTGLRDIIQNNPGAASEALPFLNTYQVVSDIPGFGNALASAMRAATAAGLSQEAQRFVNHFIRFRASRVFAAGGKQLTGNEIREATAQFVPALGEQPPLIQQRLAAMAADALGVLQSTGRAWNQRRTELITLGSPDLGEFNPMTQMFSNTAVTLQDLLPGIQLQVPGQQRNRYGYTRP
jgi:hypothetical protein